MTFIPIQDAREHDKAQNGLGIGEDGDPMFTVDVASRHAVAVTLRGMSHGDGVNMPGRSGETAFGDNLVAQSITAHNARNGDVTSGSSGNLIAPTLRARDDHGINFDSEDSVIPTYLGVRRLTPRECERLQGWPDDWTRWTADGKEIADSHRYRMIGNGVQSTVAEWIGHRIVAMDAHS